MKIPELRTELLVMRGFRDEDVDEWAAIAADSEVTQWVGDPDGLSKEDAWGGWPTSWATGSCAGAGSGRW